MFKEESQLGEAAAILGGRDEMHSVMWFSFFILLLSTKLS